jgi:hypothetical protein
METVVPSYWTNRNCLGLDFNDCGDRLMTYTIVIVVNPLKLNTIQLKAEMGYNHPDFQDCGLSTSHFGFFGFPHWMFHGVKIVGDH